LEKEQGTNVRERGENRTEQRGKKKKKNREGRNDLRKETGEVYRRTENREGEFVFERSEARAKQKKKEREGGKKRGAEQ